eukprot:c21876_g1_i1.p1 GENE.c21876_g1_i1~~c21876_g1_i1.p1  ORF type:complete len:247 (-),score=27.23 c21876_g1_i1:63-758(-)
MSMHYILNTPYRGPYPDGFESCVFATGCFWGAEKGFWKFPGVYTTAVVYAAGQVQNPSYEAVCTGRTGHTEGVLVVWDPSHVAFSDLLRQFWQCHNPTQGNRQGGDSGTQYRSGIYPTTEAQLRLSLASKQGYEGALLQNGFGPITTEIAPNQPYFFAEEYHQQYLAKPKARPYCSAEPTLVSLPPFESWAPTEDLENPLAHPRLPEEYWARYAPTAHCVIRDPHVPHPWP